VSNINYVFIFTKNIEKIISDIIRSQTIIRIIFILKHEEKQQKIHMVWARKMKNTLRSMTS
jgi:hypothetical protein